MFRLQVRHNGRWKWGIVTYDNLESATARVEDLAKVGIKARVRSNSELFD